MMMMMMVMMLMVRMRMVIMMMIMMVMMHRSVTAATAINVYFHKCLSLLHQHRTPGVIAFLP